MRLRIDAPADFAFRRTVLSHGWAMLPPFELGRRAETLATTVSVPGHGAWRFTLAEGRPGIVLEAAGRPTAEVRRALVAAARRTLSLDLDLTPFHDAVREDGRLRWIAEKRAGRLLRVGHDPMGEWATDESRGPRQHPGVADHERPAGRARSARSQPERGLCSAQTIPRKDRKKPITDEEVGIDVGSLYAQLQG